MLNSRLADGQVFQPLLLAHKETLKRVQGDIIMRLYIFKI